MYKYVSGASFLPPRYPLKANGIRQDYLLLRAPCHNRRVTLRNACVLVLWIAKHHGAEALVPLWQTQGLCKRFVEICRRSQITSPACPQPFRVGIKLQIG